MARTWASGTTLVMPPWVWVERLAAQQLLFSVTLCSHKNHTPQKTTAVILSKDVKPYTINTVHIVCFYYSSFAADHLGFYFL